MHKIGQLAIVGGQAYIKNYGRKLGEGLIVHCYCNRAGYNALYRTIDGFQYRGATVEFLGPSYGFQVLMGFHMGTVL